MKKIDLKKRRDETALALQEWGTESEGRFTPVGPHYDVLVQKGVIRPFEISGKKGMAGIALQAGRRY